MRCFIAVDIDESLLPKIQNLQQQIKNLDVRLIEENSLHFTLKFLGEIHDSTGEQVKNVLADIAAGTEKFEISLSGVGVFPNENFIRVVWVGSPGKTFSNLHDAVNDRLAGIFKKEKAVAHLTIARVRSGKDNHKIMEFVKRHREAWIGKMVVSIIKLKKSTLTREGPIYEDVAVFGLLGSEK